MTSKVHLVRHGEVANPDHIVYADLQQFGLSATGFNQAQATATYLADRPIRAVYSSPLTRAVQTALVIAAPHQMDIETVDQLTEFGLSMRWRGFRWEELGNRFPGEVDAYLDHPWDLPFSPESLDEMGVRLNSAIEAMVNGHPDDEFVVVSHQDPVQVARLRLTGRGFSSFGDDKPGHAEVITLEPGSPWRETARWAPPIDSGPFPPPPVAGTDS
jgi:broad specificity phosphatase PhoE